MYPKTKRIIFLALGAVLLIGAGVFLFYGGFFEKPYVPPPELISAPSSEQPQSDIESSSDSPSSVVSENPLSGKLFITKERSQYKSGDLQLIIPTLEVDASIWNGTTYEDLNHGACLYEYSQLPGEGDCNVSVVAHRNGVQGGKPTYAIFYYIDTLADGDYLYLSDSKNIYRYIYKDTKIVDEEDWTPIHLQGFSCLTLTSCEPISINPTPYRIVVRSELDEIFEKTDDFVYLKNADPENTSESSSSSSN